MTGTNHNKTCFFIGTLLKNYLEFAANIMLAYRLPPDFLVGVHPLDCFGALRLAMTAAA
jgi:hypothetical protein